MSYEGIKREPIKEVDRIPAKEYEKPSNRWHNATWSHTEDKGKQTNKYGTRLMLKVWFELNDENQLNGEPFLVSRYCSQSLHKDSTLFEIVSELIGGAPPQDFLLSSLKGTPCEVEVVYKEKDDGAVFADVGQVRRLETRADVASKQRIAQARDGFKKDGRKSARSRPVDDDATSFRIDDDDLADENLAN